MKKLLTAVILSLAFVLLLSACGHKAAPKDEAPAAQTPAVPESAAPAAETPEAEASAEDQEMLTITAYRDDGSPVTLEGPGDGTWKTADGVLYILGNDATLRAEGAEDLSIVPPVTPPPAVDRADGERFEDVLTILGMEETVHFEHLRNEALGFEMDFDYDAFARCPEADRERFVSVWDDPAAPENYLEVRAEDGDAASVADAIIAALSEEYDLYVESHELARAGRCTRIGAEIIKGTNNMADQLQTVYVIPASDGCRVVTEHAFVTEAEGLSRRFSYMINSLSVIDRA